jgi:hypothetical protein
VTGPGLLTANPCASSEFHDRFWIADGARGLFVGNGLGKRYALADYLSLEPR